MDLRLIGRLELQSKRVLNDVALTFQTTSLRRSKRRHLDVSDNVALKFKEFTRS
jgi:hypothetical protein